MFTIELEFERKTKNKVVFANEEFGALYVPNKKFEDLGHPERVAMTIASVQAPALSVAS